jgi:DNA-binding NarL/FixJ family response regulator
MVLIDTAVPESVTLISSIASKPGDIKVIALGVPEIESEVIVCAEAGVAGFVPRGGSYEDLISVITAVSRGEFLCSPRVAACILRRLANLARSGASPPNSLRLTPRELDILGLVDEGLTNKQIAQRLGIEPATVKNHVHKALQKLKSRNRTEASARIRMYLPRRTQPA